MDDDCGASGASRTLLPDLAKVSRRQRRSYGGWLFSGALRSGTARLGDSLPACRFLLALRFAGVNFRGCVHAAADLSFVGAASRAAADRNLWRAGRGGDYRLQARRQYPAAVARPISEVFLRSQW